MADPRFTLGSSGLGPRPTTQGPADQPGNFFSKQGNSFSDIAGGIRNVTQSLAAGFARDPRTRERYQSILAQEEAASEQDRAAQRRMMVEQSLERIGSLTKLLRAAKAQGAEPFSIRRYLEKEGQTLSQLLPENPQFAMSVVEQALAEAEIPDAPAEPDFKNVIGPDGAVIGMVNVNDQQAMSQLPQGSQLMAAAPAPEQVLPPDVEAQRIRMRPPGTTINIDTKPISEGQSAALGFADRMELAEADIGELEGKGYTGPSAQAKGLASLPVVGNYLASSEQQMFESAKLDFLSAGLRKESGAIIDYSPGGEFDKEDKKYFPQPGDGLEVIAQKKKRRQQAIANMRRQGRPVSGAEAAGTGGDSIPTVTTKADIDKLAKGDLFIYKGKTYTKN